MSFKYSQLSYFCALVEEGTVHAAADKMHCVPSNITNRIKDLEYGLQVALFNREQRKLSLTPEGRLFYQEAKQLLAQTQNAQNLFKQHDLVGHLRIGVLDFVIEKYLYPTLSLFLQQHSKVQLDVCVLSSVPLMTRLVSTQLDLILVDGDIQHPFLQSKIISHERLFLVCNERSLTDFKRSAADKILYSYGKPCLHHVLFSRWLAQHHIDYARHCAIESYHWVFQAILANTGFTVVPQVYLADVKQLGLYYYALDDVGNCDVSIVWQCNNASPLLQALVDAFDPP
jgi:DNA-binding transcriptional LysR family regulator